MESNTFYDIYLEELKNLPQGTPEEETALLKKLTEGDKTAASRLTELKLAKAVQIAEEYHDRGLPAGDLVQLPNMSVLELDPGSSPAGITDKLIIDATTPVAPDNRGHYSQPVQDLPETKAWAEKLTAMLAARQ